MSGKKKKTTAARATSSNENDPGAEKHPMAFHPAVGLLECEYKDQSGSSRPETRAGICGRDGMDAAFHKLPASAYLGPTPRPEPWRTKLYKLDQEQSEKEDPGFEPEEDDDDEDE